MRNCAKRSPIRKAENHCSRELFPATALLTELGSKPYMAAKFGQALKYAG